MTISSVTIQPSLDAYQDQSTNNDRGVKSEFWEPRRVVKSRGGLSNSEYMRFCSRLLSFGLIGGSITAVSLSAFSVVAWPIGLYVGLPCALAAYGSTWYSLQIGDYENPEELENFRKLARQMNLEKVMQTYGWNDVLRLGILTPDSFADKYRSAVKDKCLVDVINYYEKTLGRVSSCRPLKFDFKVPRPSESSKRWREETSAISFEKIIETYPLDKLEKYRIIEQGEINCINNLKCDYYDIKKQYEERVLQIESEFQLNTMANRRIYEAECAKAEQIYSSNDAVKELQGLELRYTKERQAVQNQQNQAKTEARAHFDREVASFTNGGSIPYDKLSQADKSRYERLRKEQQLALDLADTIVRSRIDQINVRRSSRLIHLNLGEVQAKKIRAQMIEAAKGQFDRDIYAHQQKKETLLGPIVNSFRSSAKDFNGRYRAYLHLVGAER